MGNSIINIDALKMVRGQNENLVRQRKSWRRLANSFGIIGPILQQPGLFFKEIREEIDLGEKIGSLFISSMVFLSIYGATLGSGHSLLSFNLAIAAPAFFLGSLAACIPVIYLLDVLTGSQRSLAQIATVLLASVGTASTVFLSFTPIMLVFSLTATLENFFWLNLGILALATAVGLLYVLQGTVQTAMVDPGHSLHKINRWLHLLWMPLYLVVMAQTAWKLVLSFQETGGPLMWLIRQLMG